MRGVSTVLDATVFLLLVTAAVGSLVVPLHQPALRPDAGASATVLTTATTEIHYSLAKGARRGGDSRFPVTDGPEFDRIRHGTLASMLVSAAVANVSVEGIQVTRTTDDFESRAATRVENATLRRVRVSAVWTPYRGAPVRGAVHAGPRPPPGAVVGVTAVRLDSGLPSVRERAERAARRDGYAGVASVVATAVVDGLFPPDRTRLALRGDYPVDALTARRYRRFAVLVDARVNELVLDARTGRANRRLSRALAPIVERDLRTRFASPEAAARAVRVGWARLVVRRWST